jgi:hypothetical protein
VARDPDDDALSWGEENDPSHVEGGRSAPGGDAAASPLAADGATVAGRGSSAGLVGLGVLAGVYLLYTVGWVLSVVRNPYALTDPFGQVMATVGDVLAVLAPLLWFGTVFLLTRGRGGARAAWLVGGVLLLVPWPFVLGGLA